MVNEFLPVLNYLLEILNSLLFKYFVLKDVAEDEVIDYSKTFRDDPAGFIILRI